VTRWSHRQIFGAALGAWLFVGMLALISGPPLGHDEAAYAVAARGDAPAWNYRSSGMIAIARIGLLLGGSDAVLRIVALLAGAGVIVAAYALGRAAFDARTGAWAAAVLATAHPMASRSAELIGDLPATACLLGGVAVLLGELERDRPRWRLVLAAPLFAAAFYVRYGSAPVIAMIAVLTVLLYARKLLCLPVLATALALAACLVPHVMHSIATTGSPLGILTVSANMPRRAYVGEGLVTYVTSNPFVFYGVVVAPVMIAALAGLALLRIRRAQLFVVGLALGQLISLGIQSHAQPRYVFFATALLVIAGVDAIRTHATSERAAAGIVGLAWLGLAIAIVPFQHYVARMRAPLYAAGAAVRDDAHGRSCAIAANVVPQLIWATGCAVIVAHSVPKLVAPWPTVEVKYIVSAPHAVVSNVLLGEVAATARAMPHEISVANPDAHAWRLDP
jgi:4-amino-4-deoxy-L-arabinose transferase-like glycosyltransferase